MPPPARRHAPTPTQRRAARAKLLVTEKELTRAILDGRIADGGQVLALDNDEHEIVLSVQEPVSV